MKYPRSSIIARALRDAGVKLLTSVPGFGATQIFDAWRRDFGGGFFYHEEVAFSVAHGAALTGLRAATAVKAHGFVKAMNSIMDALIAGTTAGLLVIVPEDKSGIHSDCILDIFPILHGMKIPVVDLEGGATYDKVVDAVHLSEEKQLPVVAVCDSEKLKFMEPAGSAQMNSSAPKWERNVFQHIVCPLLAEYQYDVFQRKLAGKNRQNLVQPDLPTIPRDVPPQWQPIIDSYQPLFEIFSGMNETMGVVASDTGISTLFAFPPFNCVDICTYMGGSVPLAMGAHLAGHNNCWAVTGDFSFVAAGHLGLLEAVSRRLSIKILVLDNQSAKTTGGQPVAADALTKVLGGYQDILISIHNGQDKTEVAEKLKIANSSARLKVVTAKMSGN